MENREDNSKKRKKKSQEWFWEKMSNNKLAKFQPICSGAADVEIEIYRTCTEIFEKLCMVIVYILGIQILN